MWRNTKVTSDTFASPPRISSCGCWKQGGEANERARDSYVVFSCLFARYLSLKAVILLSFTSLFHHCQAFLPLPVSTTFASSCSAFISFLFVPSLLPPLSFALSLSWHFCFFLSRGLRPAVPVLFEPFQVLSQQQGEIVMVLAEFVNTNSWRMRITQQLEAKIISPVKNKKIKN